MLGVDKAEATDRFSDVSSNHWAAKEISFVADKGIATGDDSGKFRPDDSLTRAQASVMMTHALNTSGLDRTTPTFKDVSRDYWAYSRIERAAEMDIFKGKNGKFHPGDNIAKAQVAAIVARAFYGEDAEHHRGDVNFSDISNSFWAKGYIATLVDNNIIRDGGSFNPNESATRAELSAYIARAMNESLQVSGKDDSHSDEASNEDVASENVLFQGTVQASTPLNVRKGPSTDYSVINTLNNGKKVDVYGTEGNWYEVRVGGKKGYVHSNYVVRADDVQADTGKAEPIYTGKVTSSKLLVRSGPASSYDKVGSFSRGDTVKVYEETNGSWVLVKYKGEWAYTHSGHLEEAGMSGKTIVIDPGHGDHDPGAQANGLVEKTINLQVGLRVEKLLKDAGVDVVMTRRNDTFVTLSGRVAIAERANADSFVSIHANAASPAAEGAETFYNNNYQARESRKLAAAIQNRLVKDTGMKYRRVADARFYVIRNTTMPSTLIELGFLTNRGDANRMKQSGYYDKAARAVYNGIKDYYSE